jgi:hypothetical protein
LPKAITQFAVEVPMEIVHGTSRDISFSILARDAGDNSGISASVNGKIFSSPPDVEIGAGAGIGHLAAKSWDAGNRWHAYRVEANGATYRLLVDGHVLLPKAVSHTCQTCSRIGLLFNGRVFRVGAFKILTLH